MASPLHIEDFPVGETIEYGDVLVTAEAIVAFAQDFDPQPFHLDDAAARPLTGGLIASGWHTAALLARMNADAFLMRAAALADDGIEEIKWLKPVRPGDRLHVRRTTRTVRPAGAGAGEVEFLYEVVDETGATAMTQASILRLAPRDAEAGDVL